jgi:hypothetical protein
MNITDFYNLNPTELSVAIIIFNLLFALVLQMIIVYVYKKTRHGLSYSQAFIFTILIIGTLSSAIMMAVQNNIIGAFAIFAAFTLIRFRTILKEPSDLAYVFFALVVGISTGMSHYSLALITTLFMSTVIYLFYRFGFGSVSDNFDYLLIFSTNGKFDLNSIDKVMDENVYQRELLHAKHFDNQRSEFSLSLRLKDTNNIPKVVDYLKSIESVIKVEVLTGKSTTEY